MTLSNVIAGRMKPSRAFQFSEETKQKKYFERKNVLQIQWIVAIWHCIAFRFLLCDRKHSPFYFLLQSDVSLTKFLWKQKMSSFSLFVRFIIKMIDWITKTAILNGDRTFCCIQFDRFMISLVFFLVLVFLTKDSPKQYEEI